jgi:hypothetical protein
MNYESALAIAWWLYSTACVVVVSLWLLRYAFRGVRLSAMFIDGFVKGAVRAGWHGRPWPPEAMAGGRKAAREQREYEARL